jgi:predicted lipid-binding transport protein (Tim44 family)
VETPESEAPPVQKSEPEAAPLDADDTRGIHLKRLMGNPVTLSLGAVLLIACFVGGTMAAGALVGGIAAVVGALLVLLIVYVMASNAAKEDFFSSYSQSRGLQRTPGKSSLPPTTPLLRKGDRRYAEEVMHGTLPGGNPGALGLYTYEVETRDSEGNTDNDYYHFTVVMHDIPTAAAQASDVYCQRREGFRFMDSAEDAFRRMQRLELESDALDKRYEVFFGAQDDEVWMKRLFSPTFIVWLTENTPKDFAFEFSAGSLCVNTKGHRDNATDLDAVCKAAGEVAARLASSA